jgi:hypothetical protein
MKASEVQDPLPNVYTFNHLLEHAEQAHLSQNSGRLCGVVMIFPQNAPAHLGIWGMPPLLDLEAQRIQPSFYKH